MPMWSSTGLVVVVDIAGGCVGGTKSGRYLTEEIDEAAGGMTNGAVVFLKIESGVIELDGDPVVRFTGI